MFSTKNRQNGPADGSANITKVYQAVPADNVDYLSTKILSYPHNVSFQHIIIILYMINDNAVSAGDLGFDSRCFFGAVLPRREAAEMDPVTRYTLWHNIPSIIKI